MSKNIARNLAVAFTFIALVAPVIHASTTSAAVAASSPTVSASPSVTGGDPEPTSPDVAQMILIFLYLA